MKIGFEQLKKMNVEEIQKIEDIYLQLPETAFKLTYQKPKQNFAEELVEELKNER